MTASFCIITLGTLLGAIGAMSCRNLIHCALALMVAFTGLACFYLQLHAEFIGLTQVLVYIGAVAILIVFAILLTRGGAAAPQAGILNASWAGGLLVALLVAGTLLYSVLKSSSLERPAPHAEASARQIGDQLMGLYILPLEVVALLLTAAMIGAVILAMQEKRKPAPTIPASTMAPGAPGRETTAASLASHA